MGGKRAPPLRTSLAGSRWAAKPWAHAGRLLRVARQLAPSCTHGQEPILGGEHLQEEFQSAWPIGDTSAPAPYARGLASRLGDLPPPPNLRPLHTP